MTTEEKPTVLIVDDDPDVCDSLQFLLRTVGLDCRAMLSLPEFLKAELPSGPTCLVLDVRLPGRSGLDFQRELSAANINLPIVFITGHGDIPMSVKAMKAGAVEFLTKPFRDQDLLEAIQLGLARHQARCESERQVALLRDRFNTLTSRQREVMAHIVDGHPNKRIASRIGISVMTVKIHRGHVMRKMEAASLPELTRIVDKLREVGLLADSNPVPR
jgi:FixJ family two-component response regulator